MYRSVFLLFFLVTISCSKKEFKVESIQFPYGNNNAQPNLVSKDGNLTLSWISSVENQEAVLFYTQYKDNSWSEPVRITSGSDWFVNWADFPANAINGNLLLTSYLKKSASGTYTYDILLNLETLSRKKIKDNFLLNTDGIKAEHGFVSMIPNNSSGFYVTWLDGRNTVINTKETHHKAMTIRFAEITSTGEIINETELDATTCDCCQTSIALSSEGPIVVYRNRSEDEIRDIYITKYRNGIWEQPVPVFNDGWEINGCPVNGPKVVVNKTTTAIAWFTAADDNPKVNLSFSLTDKDEFNLPIQLNDLDAIGRVDVAFLNSKEVLVSYMEFDDNATYLNVKKVTVEGEVSKAFTISKIDSGRETGVPQLEVMDNVVYLVWTNMVDGKNQLKFVKFNSDDLQ
ncbi:sialidase [Flavobacteriaceae bacterium]|nr:sialidase [Flavobacteriaceae bacterium]